MKKTGIIAIISASIFLFSGCSSSSLKASDMAKPESINGYQSNTAGSYGGAMDYDTLYEEGSISNKETKSASNDLSERKIIKTANLRFETEQYDDFLPSVENCISSLGGYIESSEAYGGGIYSSGSRNTGIVARIPANNYSRFMNEVCAIGTLTYKSESTDDVTLSYVDMESRLKSLQTEYDALIEILEKAESLDDVILLQSRIGEVTYQLESYQSKLRKYDDLIAYCTVNIDISEVRRVSQNEEVMTFGERITSGLRETFFDIGEGFSDFAVWFIVNLPYIVIWALIITGAALFVRLLNKKYRKKKEKKMVEQLLKNVHEKEN